jgi:hypothetical protein
MFSNPTFKIDGIHAGDAYNDCARKHNDSRQRIANYRAVRLTSAPTLSHAPTASQAPSRRPSAQASVRPSASLAPSLAPSASLAPSDVPSEFPTFGSAVDEDHLRLRSPGSAAYQVALGLMFDVTARAHDVTIWQFRLPFANPGEMVMHIYTRAATGGGGAFWYEKNNRATWTMRDKDNSLAVTSPGITILDPMPISQRGGENYGCVVLPIATPVCVVSVVPGPMAACFRQTKKWYTNLQTLAQLF